VDDVREEPVFSGATGPVAENDPDGIWGEPALADASAADPARERRKAWLGEQWTNARPKARIGTFILLSAFSGLAAVLCAILKASSGYGILMFVVAAPVAEEMAKTMLPLMVLEKRPWLFGSHSSIVLVGLLSGAVFASVENALYFFVYIPAAKLTFGIVLWRLIVCTAMHVGCTMLACGGLARAWSRAREACGEFKMSVALPWLVAAVVIHGVYNLGAFIYSVASR